MGLLFHVPWTSKWREYWSKYNILLKRDSVQSFCAWKVSESCTIAIPEHSSGVMPSPIFVTREDIWILLRKQSVNQSINQFIGEYTCIGGIHTLTSVSQNDASMLELAWWWMMSCTLGVNNLHKSGVNVYNTLQRFLRRIKASVRCASHIQFWVFSSLVSFVYANSVTAWNPLSCLTARRVRRHWAAYGVNNWVRSMIWRKSCSVFKNEILCAKNSWTSPDHCKHCSYQLACDEHMLCTSIVSEELCALELRRVATIRNYELPKCV